MNEDTDRQVQPPPGRLMNVTVYGDTAEELELAALDQARKFFGSDPRLEVVRDYQVTGVIPGNHTDANGKLYVAGMRVRTIEPQ